ncbi:hypothetical protein GMORB2_4652 [Geosmithia morbida]|uniref:Rhodopsin domain-containing protein n=1 Tax=Geosmithia morbida TaxID=1094350 RepID=A0A9P5CYL2_9HYPO|nr:uncharacterized protein GMORB2_4652 [Geosmithia morbida]KAF4119522.1 hypothetical protein GMORB2_4652 [Geosmithia morbida]
MSPVEGSSAWEAQDKGPRIVSVCWAVTAFSTLFVIARVYVRGYVQRKLQQDDYWTLLALVCGYISTSLSTVAVASGNGKHMALLSQDQQEGAVLWTTAAFCPGVMSFGLPKLAVVYLLTKLLNPGKWHRVFLWWQGIWCQMTLLTTAGLLIGRCRPAYSLWTFDVKGDCFSKDILVSYCIYAGCFSAFVDFYLAIYPAIVLFKLQLPFRKKFALCIALGIGSVLTDISLSLSLSPSSGVVAVYKTTRIPSLASDDFSYDTSDLVVWTVVEGSTIMIASTIPILQPLLKKFLNRNPLSSNSRSKYKFTSPNEVTDNNRSYEMSHRKFPSKAKDELGFTVLGEGGSQDDILAQTPSNPGGTPPPGSVVATDKSGSHQITRTDMVTVTYENVPSQPSMPNSFTKAWGGRDGNHRVDANNYPSARPRVLMNRGPGDV